MTGAGRETTWRRRLLAVLILVIAPVVDPSATALAADWPADAYVLRVDGLACPYCGYGIEKQFAKRAGVVDTDIDVERGVVIVLVSPGTRFPDGELRRIVHDAGFALGEIVQRPRGDR